MDPSYDETIYICVHKNITAELCPYTWYTYDRIWKHRDPRTILAKQVERVTRIEDTAVLQ